MHMRTDVLVTDVAFQVIFQQSPISTQIFSPDGMTVMVNNAWEKLWQVKPDAIVGHYNILKDKQLIEKKIMPYIKRGFAGEVIAIPEVKYEPEKTIPGVSKITYRWVKAIMYPIQDETHKNILIVLQHIDVTDLKVAEERERFLEQASIILGASIDYSMTLKNLSNLIVPFLADYCRIVVLDDTKQIQEITAKHVDSKQLPLVKQLYTAYSKDTKNTAGVGRLIYTGKSERIRSITPEIYRNANPKIARLIKKLHLQSYMGIPMKIGNSIVGALTFSSTNKERIYTKEDQLLAEELARRAALAIENAKLFHSVQKELRERIKAQEEQVRLTTILNQTFDSIILWKFSGEIVYWNQGAEELYGYTKEEALGKNIHQLLQTVHLVPYSTIQKELIKTGRWEGEIKHTTKSNKQLILSCKKVFIAQDGGEKFVLETNRDITEHISLEEKLQFLSEASKILSSSLDFKTTLVNVAKLAVPQMADWCSVDMKTDKGIEQLAITHVDPKKVKWAKELRRKNPPSPNEPTGVPQVLRTGKSEYVAYISDAMLVQVAKNDKELALLRRLQLTSVMLLPIFIGKEVVGVISFVSAESGRRYTKSDLAIAEELAGRAGIAIENAKLYTNAKNAISLRNDFISLASHELKTPITSLKMYAQSLRNQFEKRGNTKFSHYFEKLDQQTNKLTLLVNDLLNVSKIQHGKLEFSMDYIDLNLLVKDTVDSVQETIQTHTIIIEGKLQKKVYADQYRIYQVLTNLLTNAVKYSPNATKVLVRLVPEKNAVVVIVQDFGIGIDKDQQKKIFGQFYRVENPEEKTFPGLGMGLYISQEIVKRHGSTIRVVSNKEAEIPVTEP